MPINESFNILCLGDIVGQPGRHILDSKLNQIQSEFNIDFTIANIENSASGFGFNNKLYHEFIQMKMDAFTSGNHVYAKREVIEKFNIYDRLVRPINFPKNQLRKSIILYYYTFAPRPQHQVKVEEPHSALWKKRDLLDKKGKKKRKFS